MNNYLKKSYDKFRQDSLSKLFYDILKWLMPAIFVFAFSKLFPTTTSIGQFLSIKIVSSLYALLLFILILVASTVIVVSLIFNNRYRALKKDSITDELTGLKNHKAFKEYLSNKIEELGQSEKTFSIIVLDVDNFKRFNTDYNPTIADGILGKIGELLGNDKRITDETFRQFLRGDEFVVVAYDTSLNDAYKAAERKRNLIEKTSFIVDEHSYRLTVSCGVTEYKKGKDDLKTLTNRVNAALVEAKQQIGKNNTKTAI